MELRKKDMAILTFLRQDARITLTKLSRKTGIPVTTIYERLKQYRSSGLIQFTTLVDFSMLGFKTRLLIALKVDRKKRSELQEYLTKHLYVNNVQRINNGFTFMVEAAFRDMTTADDFLEELEERFKIKSKMVFHVLEDVSREIFMSDPSQAELPFLCGD